MQKSSILIISIVTILPFIAFEYAQARAVAAHKRVRFDGLSSGGKKLLQQIVQKANGKTVLVNSAYRSRSYNRRIGGARRSQHIYGRAIDFKIRGMSIRSAHRLAASIPGVNGLGCYRGHVHADVRSWKACWGGCGCPHMSRKDAVKRDQKRKNRRQYRRNREERGSVARVVRRNRRANVRRSSTRSAASSPRWAQRALGFLMDGA